MEQSAKVVLFDQLLENQGEELFGILIETQLSMVQLYYLKEQDMVVQLNAGHTNLREQEESEGTKSKKEEEDQDAMCEIIVTEFAE